MTDGNDNQRTGWQRNETILTKKNVRNLKILWKIQTGNQVRSLHSLMPVLIIGRLNTANGPREVGIVNGISDNLYGFDVESGTILWQKHWDYAAPAAAGGPPAAANADPAHLSFLRPGGSSDTPVIGPADAQGRRPVYFVTGDGMLHVVNAADGSDLEPPYMFHIGKGWSLNLVGNVLWMANTYAGISIAAVKVDDPRHKVMTFNAGSGGAWGRRGAAIDSSGTAWFTTGDGIYDVDVRSSPLRQQRRRRAHGRRRAEAEELFRAEELGMAAKTRSRSEQYADGLHLQGAGADRRVGQGVPHVPARSAVSRRSRQPDASVQERSLLQ